MNNYSGSVRPDVRMAVISCLFALRSVETMQILDANGYNGHKNQDGRLRNSSTQKPAHETAWALKSVKPSLNCTLSVHAQPGTRGRNDENRFFIGTAAFHRERLLSRAKSQDGCAHGSSGDVRLHIAMKKSLLFSFVSLVLPGGNEHDKEEGPPCRMFCDEKHLGKFHYLATEADPKRRDLDCGKYDVTQLTNQKASLPVLKERRWRNAELDLPSVFKNAFRINSQFAENRTCTTAN